MSSRVTSAFNIPSTSDVTRETRLEKRVIANHVAQISIEALPIPAWITSREGHAVLLNDHAKALVNRGCLISEEKPCQRVLQESSILQTTAQSSSEQSHLNSDVCQRVMCDGRCCLIDQGSGDGNSACGDLLIAVSKGNPRWFRVFVSTYQENASQSPQLLHLAFDIDKAHRIESYFERIVARSGQSANHHRSLSALTRREKEVLDMLAADETLWGIADRLCLSYSTVRNHVRNILAKFGVHSIIEAVALYLTAS